MTWYKLEIELVIAESGSELFGFLCDISCFDTTSCSSSIIGFCRCIPLDFFNIRNCEGLEQKMGYCCHLLFICSFSCFATLLLSNFS
jgi:hypothetical protein